MSNVQFRICNPQSAIRNRQSAIGNGPRLSLADFRPRPVVFAATCMTNRAVFLDRDGTLNVDKNYLSDPAQLEILPGTGRALRRLIEAGFLLFIVTNQSGIGRGYYTVQDLEQVNTRLCAELAKDGVRFAKIFFATEAPDQPSRGRKPSPQFLFDAQAEFGLDLGQCYMIGDKLIDVACGENAGVARSILVRTGYGRRVEQQSPAELDQALVVDDLPAAVHWILD